jgi:acetyl-CoA acetyltransferase
LRYENTVIPLRAAWSSPFVRWQGEAADLNSLDLAAQVTADALKRTGVEWPIEELVLGLTIPQKRAFYGAPTLAARLGFGGVSGPMISQACATSVAAVHAAATSQQGAGGARLVVATDRTSNGPQLTYPRPHAPGGAPESEHWVLDSFERDPVTGESMLRTAERVAAQASFSKTQLDELTVRRYEQYEDALADDRAFQKRWMVPITTGSPRRPLTIDSDRGVRPVTIAGLAELPPIERDGVVSYGSQTHPADGTAGMIVTTPELARELGVEGPMATVLAARAALADASLDIADIDVIKSHNPFIVNDLWFAQEMGIDPIVINPYGCSLIYGHPQGPTGARGIVELIHALELRGGGRGLFTGCAAGDSGAAIVVEVSA